MTANYSAEIKIVILQPVLE